MYMHTPGLVAVHKAIYHLSYKYFLHLIKSLESHLPFTAVYLFFLLFKIFIKVLLVTALKAFFPLSNSLFIPKHFRLSETSLHIHDSVLQFLRSFRHQYEMVVVVCFRCDLHIV